MHRCLKLLASVAACWGLSLACVPSALAQGKLAPEELPPQHGERGTAAGLEKEVRLVQEVLEPEVTLELDPARSRIIRTKKPVQRIAISDPSIVEVNEFSLTEFEMLGQKAGETAVTIWFGDANEAPTVLRYLVKVAPKQTEQHRAEREYHKLQTRINELFPNSQIILIPIADKLIVRGQARDSKEAAEIIAILGGQSASQSGGGGYGGGNISTGGVVRLPDAIDLQTTSLINLIHVPGEQQVMLRVRVAELTRTAARELGLDIRVKGDNFSVSNVVGGAGNLSAILDSGDVQLFMRAFSSNGYGKILAEPTLVTLSGSPATFIAGGEFAVPTAVGVEGVAAVATAFRGFGTQLSFTPRVIDKDKIRLQVSPSFSTLNNANAVDGIPGLNTRAVTTTVDLREGQWLAIAGLIQDEQQGTRGRVPYIGDIPVVGGLFGKQQVKRDETELIVLVSPELVHPLELEQVPVLLPGMEVTEPTNGQFYFLQQIEGRPNFHHRSTVWPTYHEQIRQAKHAAHGYGEGNSQSYFICGPNGFSQ